MVTSAHLQMGEIYTRSQLKEMFAIRDATINNGIFRPQGHDSIWLFVTKIKSADKTPYQDDLQGDTLIMDGQQQGRTDRILIHHEADGREVILFFRERRDSHPGNGFRYEGLFRY